jgi:hypothetical protein
LRCSIGELNEICRLAQDAHLRCPALLDVERKVPQWFRSLGTAEGVDRFEQQHGVSVPAVLRDYYACPRLACLLALYADTDSLLVGLEVADPPPLVKWFYRWHVVIGNLSHSDLVIAAELDCDSPRLYWGDWGAETPLRYPPALFAPWLVRIVLDSLTDNERFV